MTIEPRATRRGGRLDWVKFDFDLARDGSVDPTDKALYAALASFVDMESRESPETVDVDLNGIPRDVPTRKRLAACIGRSPDTVDRATKRLEERGLLRVHRQEDPDNPKLNLPSEYELLDHHLWDQRAAERAARRGGQGGGRMGAATPGRASAATPGRMDAAVKDVREVEEENEGEKSPPDGRRPSTGSSGSSEGGSAASGKTSPRPSPANEKRSSKKKPKHTAAQRAAVLAVRAHFPDGLRPADVPVLSDAILAAMATGRPDSRTVEQLAARIDRRWYVHGWARKADEGEEIKSPVGVAIDLVRTYGRDDKWGCAAPRCEDGADVDTGEACTVCPERLEDRKAARGRTSPASGPSEPAMPGQRPPGALGFRECKCGNPVPKSSDGDLCRTCQKWADALQDAGRAAQAAKAPF